VSSLLLRLVDLLEDLLVRREAVVVLVRVGGAAVDEDFEDAADAFLQPGGDAVLVLDGGLQTGGLGEVVSLSAVEDLDVHGSSFPWKWYCRHCI
jgi:hypothetical protein